MGLSRVIPFHAGSLRVAQSHVRVQVQMQVRERADEKDWPASLAGKTASASTQVAGRWRADTWQNVLAGVSRPWRFRGRRNVELTVTAMVSICRWPATAAGHGSCDTSEQ